MIKLKPGKLSKIKKEAKLGAKRSIYSNEKTLLRIKMDAARKREELDRKREKQRKKK